MQPKKTLARKHYCRCESNFDDVNVSLAHPYCAADRCILALKTLTFVNVTFPIKALS